MAEEHSVVVILSNNVLFGSVASISSSSKNF
jgi:hypothetical protein